MNDKIVVVDFGSQYNQVIVKSLRKLKIYSVLVAYDEINDYLKTNEVSGIILSGGPMSVYDKDAYTLNEDFFATNVPILGVCYGMQYLVHSLGGKVEKTEIGEYGITNIQRTIENNLFGKTPMKQDVLMSHADSVIDLGDDFISIANSQHHIAAVKHKNKEIYGVQFHIEVTHTEYGHELLKNFCLDICKVQQNFSMEEYVKQISKEVIDTVGTKKVVCALSGGVDSSVVAALLTKIIPNQVVFFFVDTGLLRLNEGKELFEIFKKDHNLEVTQIDGAKQMFDALSGLTDPEDKRKAIGKTFIDIFQSTINEIVTEEVVEFLAQGTLYSDVIESGTKTSHKIKSHHNVGGLPKDMTFKLIEPLNKLFKDEVRELGSYLGLPKSIVSRQPFPGPGLGIRIMGEVTREKVDILQQANKILSDTLEKTKYNNLWQYFCVLTDTMSVGVKGDMRAYEYVLAIRAVESEDGMTANFAHIDFNVLEELSINITNQVKGVTRVVYDITSKPPGTIEWE